MVLGIVFGPTSGALVAMTAVETCAQDCPCDAADADAGHDAGDVIAECGPDCPNCDCCTGLVTAVVPSTMRLPSRLPPEGHDVGHPPSLATGSPANIFIPPRS